jgi:uncharacterized protein (DUF2235 family)
MTTADGMHASDPSEPSGNVTKLLRIKRYAPWVPAILLFLMLAVLTSLQVGDERALLERSLEIACRNVEMDAARHPRIEREKPTRYRHLTYGELCAWQDPLSTIKDNFNEMSPLAGDRLLTGFSLADFWERDNDGHIVSLTKGAVDYSKYVAAVTKVVTGELQKSFVRLASGASRGLILTLLCAIPVGLAGLIYRRRFWTWFLIALGAMLIIVGVIAHFGVVGEMMGLAPKQSEAVVKARVEMRSKLWLKDEQGNYVRRPSVDERKEYLELLDREDNAIVREKMEIIVLVGVALLLALLVANRVRCQTRKPNMLASHVPTDAFNGILVMLLAICAFGIAGLGWGQSLFLFLAQKPPSDEPNQNTVLALALRWTVVLLVLPLFYRLLRQTPTWRGKRRKNIVICLDGTSNTPAQVEQGLAAQTNVFKLFKMLKSDKEGIIAPDWQYNANLLTSHADKQIAFYYTGIGNNFDNDMLTGTLSMATGLGATGIIERAYLDLISVWRPGDRVFIFGFSRGAASARILSRIIDQRGVPKAIWTVKLLGRHWPLWTSRTRTAVPIDVLGCWDTVGSFGVAKTIGGINFQQLNLLHDMTVPDNVRQAYHMVALDEERQEFEPTLMEPDPIHPARIVEVWFPGSHAGVGGGYATDRLSDVPLRFLLQRISSGYCDDGTTEPGDERWGVYLAAINGTSRAARSKIVPSTSAREINPDPLGQLRFSNGHLYNYRPRRLPLHAVVANEVFERMRKADPVYAPRSLFDHNKAIVAEQSLIEEELSNLSRSGSVSDTEKAEILGQSRKLHLVRWEEYWKAVVNMFQPRDPCLALNNELDSTNSAIDPQQSDERKKLGSA